MVGIYRCKKCGIDFLSYGIEYCPFCGSELEFLGLVLGLGERWKNAKQILFINEAVRDGKNQE